MIPVHRPYLGERELRAVERVFESRWLGKGEVSEAFEEKLSSYLGAQHVIAVNSGTAALHVALVALDLDAGAEVLVPSLTFPATVQAILLAGARPVFCEVRPETLNLDPADAARRISPRTRAILPVHYAGVACEMDAILDLARRSDLRVVEDAAHAFGSSYQGRKIGTLGDVTCFSFDPIKNITCGGGGAMATDDAELARRMLPRRNIGIERDPSDLIRRYRVLTTGHRYQLADLNAAIGIEQLERMEAFRRRRIHIVRRYEEAFSGVRGLVVAKHDWAETFPFSYVLRVTDGQRDEMMAYLEGKGIETSVDFTPNHLQPAFASYASNLPLTQRLFGEILTLPLYYEMSDEDVETVVRAVRSFADRPTL